jgi:hypothetical protein
MQCYLGYIVLGCRIRTSSAVEGLYFWNSGYLHMT